MASKVIAIEGIAGDPVRRPDELLVAITCIFHRRRILLHRRHHPGMPAIHGRFDFPGGKVEEGETPLDAALREVWEETGLHIEVRAAVPFDHVNVWSFAEGLQYVRVVCLVGHLDPAATGEIDPARYGAWGWYELREIDRSLSLPGVDRFLAWVSDHLDELSIHPS